VSTSIEVLTIDRLNELWPKLRGMFAQSCDGNELSKDELTPEDILVLAAADRVLIVVGFDNGEPACTIAVQFSYMNEKKVADIMALAGKDLTLFKNQYWSSILEWFRGNQVDYVDAVAAPKLANILLKRYGFTKSAVQVRMDMRG
jgi:hypothetical protein